MKQSLLKSLMTMFLLGGVFVMAMAQNVAYGWASMSDGTGYNTVSLDLNTVTNTRPYVTPETLNSGLGTSLGGVKSFYGGTSAGKNYYALLGIGDPLNPDSEPKIILHSVNFEKGTAKAIGSAHKEEFNCLTYSDVTGKLYATTINTVDSTTTLYVFNVEDGTKTQIAVLPTVYNSLVADNINGGFYGLKNTYDSKKFKAFPSIYYLWGEEANFASSLMYKEETQSVNRLAPRYDMAVGKGSVWFTAGAYVYVYEDGKVTYKGNTSTALYGLTFTKSTEGGTGTSQGGGDDEEPTVKRLLVRQLQYGDAMGDVPDDVDMKKTEYFYDSDCKLLRVGEYGREYVGNTGGQYNLTKYHKYEYDEKGNQTATSAYQWGQYDYGDFAFKESPAEATTSEYNDNNQCVMQTTSSYIYTYEYDGDGNLIKTSKFTKKNYPTKASQIIEYSDFTDGKNKPTVIKSTSETYPNNTSYVYDGFCTYDEKGNKVQEILYKSGATSMEEPDVVYSVETWTYDEENDLAEYMKLKPNSEKNIVPNSKTVYEKIDGDRNRIRRTSYTWKAPAPEDENQDGTWNRSGLPWVDEYAEFGEILPYIDTQLTVTKDETELNTAVLKFPMPMTAMQSPCKINIYRNGLLIATEDIAELMTDDVDETSHMPVLAYTDHSLANGEYEYYVQTLVGTLPAGDEFGEGEPTYTGFCVSNLASVTMNVNLPAVTDIKAVSKRTDEHGDEIATITWTNPAEVSDAKLGFIKNGLYFSKKQLAESETEESNVNELEASFYLPTMKVFVLTTYKYGKAKSEEVEIDLSQVVSTGVSAVTVAGATVSLDGRVLSLSENADVSVYTVNGSLVTKASGTSVDLGGLSAGAYVICVEQNGVTNAYKMVLK